MIYLGIHNSFQAGAALIDRGVIVGAVSEERFTRKKDHHGFPYRSINYVLDVAGKRLDEVDYIVYEMVTPNALTGHLLQRVLDDTVALTSPH